MIEQKECLYCKKVFTLEDKKGDRGNFKRAKYCDSQCCWKGFRGKFNEYKTIEDTVEIYIKDKVVLIDLDDLWKVSDYRWYIGNNGYPSCKNSVSNYLMHHLIVGRNKNGVIDHINRNKLDNRKVNLRKVSHKINTRNSDMLSSNTSGTKGVVWSSKDKRWVARIADKDKTIYLGQFKEKKDAIKCRKIGELTYWGENY